MRNVDYINLDQAALEEMPNGFLSFLANLTRTGLFVYQKISANGDIEIVRQLRLPEEHSPEMLASLTGAPVTSEHPEELVRPENASDFIVGMSSDAPKKVYMPVQNGDSEKEEFIQQRLTVFDEDSIDEIKDREKTQISLGYTCELEFTPGTYKGVQYDAIQRNIRVNHISLVRRARGGNNCKVIVDGREEVVNFDGLTDLNDNHNGDKNVKIFIHDGKEFKVDDDVFTLLTSFKTNLDSAENRNSEKQKEVDKLTAIRDDLEVKLKAQKDAEDADEFKAAVKARVALESKAQPILGKDVNLDALSDIEIKAKVVSKIRPGINLDEKSDEYIDARYEIALEDYNADSGDDKSGSDKDRKRFGKKIVQTTEDSDDPWEMTEKARRAAWEKTKNLSKLKGA